MKTLFVILVLLLVIAVGATFSGLMADLIGWWFLLTLPINGALGYGCAWWLGQIAQG